MFNNTAQQIGLNWPNDYRDALENNAENAGLIA
jgi:hypothetical protein